MNQEIFTVLVGSQMFEYQARLAGADIKKGRRKKGRGSDPYGEMLEQRKQFKQTSLEMTEADWEKYSKPL